MAARRRAVRRQLFLWAVEPPEVHNLAAGYTYDSEGRLTNIAYPTGSNGATANLRYTSTAWAV